MRTRLPRLVILTCAALACALSVTAQTVPQKSGAATGTAVLRVACDGSAVGAEVTVNGSFKGECPLDMPVPAGTVKLRVLQKMGVERERVFEREFRLAADTAKRVDVELGEPQRTAEGRRLENEALARAKAEAERQAAQRLRATDVVASALLSEQRARHPGLLPECPDCPAPPRLASIPVRVELPSLSDPIVNAWAQQAKQQALAYQAHAGGFVPPPQVMAMPCESAAMGMRTVAGLTSLHEKSPQEQEDLLRSWRQSSAHPVLYVRDVKLWPVQASCTAGQLSGPLEFWAFGVSVTGVDASIRISRELSHITTVMTNGKQSGPLTETKVLRELARHTDAELEALVKKNPDLYETMQVTSGTRDAQGSGTARSSVVMLKFSENPEVQKKIDLAFGIFVQPSAGDRGVQSVYTGAELMSKVPMKRDKQHGEMLIYTISPPISMCFRQGEVVKINPCDVN